MTGRASPPDVGATLRASVNDGVLAIMLTRADARNALIRPTLDGIERLVRWAAVAPEVRALLVAAEGRHFSVGDDFAGVGDHEGVPSTDESECFDSYTRVAAALLGLRKPVVAALHGAVFGGAMDIALACDLRVGDDTTIIGASYTEHGFAAGTSLLPLYVGMPRARRMLMLAERVDARSAEAFGLIDFRVDEGCDTAEATALARRLASGPTMAFGMVKSALLAGVTTGVLERLRVDEEIALHSVVSADGREGVNAFVDKRHPAFNGRWAPSDGSQA